MSGLSLKNIKNGTKNIIKSSFRNLGVGVSKMGKMTNKLKKRNIRTKKKS
jgi:hypothetical protein